MKPFADKYRPTTLSEVVGQKHIIGPGMVLDKLLKNGGVTNMIFYGPPGTGKTTIAQIIAQELKLDCVKMNAIEIGVKEIRAAMAKHKNGMILYIDEFHMLNKKQQQELLDATEKGLVILIASTTENPYFSIYKAILSRSIIFEIKPIEVSDVESRLMQIIPLVEKDFNTKVNIEKEGIRYIAEISNGDMRSAINFFELAFKYKYEKTDNTTISLTDVKVSNPSRAFDWDSDGDSKYDTLSALHKSLRGSDVDAALFYLARLLKGGDLQGICRRLLCVASEDIGMADSNAIILVKSCVDSALVLGMPEARLPLAHAVTYLALAPKSNSVCMAIDAAINDVETKHASAIPSYLRDGHYAGAEELGRAVGYKYPHNYPNNWVKQNYLPLNLEGTEYYKPQANYMENKFAEYWQGVKGDEE